jgi:predicted dehydrogenase
MGHPTIYQRKNFELNFQPLRIAIIGCGDISERHLQAWNLQSSRAAIVACCDPDSERALKAVEACGDSGAVSVSDYRDLIDATELDAVDLCLPHHLHAPAAIAFAEAGKHVLC